MESKGENRNPKFSVVVPVYNVKDYLERCMESLLDQDFTSYEIILVDDGSTDGSEKLCDKYGKYNSVSVIHKENGGLASARNAGIGIISGEYVIFIDSDDWIDKSTLTLLDKAIQENRREENPVDLVKYNYMRHAGEIKAFESCVKSGSYKGEKIDELLELALCDTGKYSLSACTHAYRSELIKENDIRFISEREVGSEDFLFNFQVMFHVKNVVVLDMPLYHYDCRQGSLTQRYRKELPEKYTVFFHRLIEYMKKIGVYDHYIGQVSYFYIWTLLYGTCLVNEYSITEDHSLKEGRKNVRKYLKCKELKAAIKKCNNVPMMYKQKVQMRAMKWGFEPLFYYLFYVKPKRNGKKG